MAAKSRLLKVNRHPHPSSPGDSHDQPAPGDAHTAELLTIAEAAQLLRAPVATLRYWRHLGTGPTSFRLGRRVLGRRDDLRTWIDARHDADSAGRP